MAIDGEADLCWKVLEDAVRVRGKFDGHDGKRGEDCWSIRADVELSGRGLRVPVVECCRSFGRGLSKCSRGFWERVVKGVERKKCQW